MPETGDWELVRRIRSGDAEALNTLARRWYAADIILSTRKGRFGLFARRLFSALILTAVSVMRMTGLVTAAALLMQNGRPAPGEWAENWFHSAGCALAGAAGLCLTAALLADILRSQMAVIVLCGPLFLVNYLLNADLLTAWSLEWFLRYGFFAELLRGRALPGAAWMWAIWYALLMGIPLAISIHRRKELRQL